MIFLSVSLFLPMAEYITLATSGSFCIITPDGPNTYAPYPGDKHKVWIVQLQILCLIYTVHDMRILKE